jgi:hypothetical protein
MRKKLLLCADFLRHHFRVTRRNMKLRIKSRLKENLSNHATDIRLFIKIRSKGRQWTVRFQNSWRDFGTEGPLFSPRIRQNDFSRTSILPTVAIPVFSFRSLFRNSHSCFCGNGEKMGKSCSRMTLPHTLILTPRQENCLQLSQYQAFFLCFLIEKKKFFFKKRVLIFISLKRTANACFINFTLYVGFSVL